MTLANDIIYGKDVDFDIYLRQGESLDDIDEYGFTPLIDVLFLSRVFIFGIISIIEHWANVFQYVLYID